MNKDYGDVNMSCSIQKPEVLKDNASKQDIRSNEDQVPETHDWVDIQSNKESKDAESIDEDFIRSDQKLGTPTQQIINEHSSSGNQVFPIKVKQSPGGSSSISFFSDDEDITRPPITLNPMKAGNSSNSSSLICNKRKQVSHYIISYLRN